MLSIIYENAKQSKATRLTHFKCNHFCGQHFWRQRCEQSRVVGGSKAINSVAIYLKMPNGARITSSSEPLLVGIPSSHDRARGQSSEHAHTQQQQSKPLYSIRHKGLAEFPRHSCSYGVERWNGRRIVA